MDRQAAAVLGLPPDSGYVSGPEGPGGGGGGGSGTEGGGATSGEGSGSEMSGGEGGGGGGGRRRRGGVPKLPRGGLIGTSVLSDPGQVRPVSCVPSCVP